MGPETDDLDESVANDISKAFDEVEGAATETEESVEPQAAGETAEVTATAPSGTDSIAGGASLEAKEWDRPPAGLSTEHKAAWKEWPENIRKEFVRREADFHKGIEEYKSGHQFSRAVVDIIKPYEPIIRAEGGTYLGAISNLIQTAYELRQDPSGVISRLAQMYGVNLQQMQAPAQQTDPHVAAMQQRIQQLEGYVQNSLGSQQQQVNAYAQQELEKFLADPSHLYYDEVKPDMAVLLSQGRATDLKDAYDKAVWANPKIRPLMLAEQQRKSEQERIAKAKQKAANASRASFDVSGSGPDQPTAQDMDLRQELERLYG